MGWLLYDLYYLLDGPCAVSVSAEAHWVEPYLLDNPCELVFFAVFSYLLGEIVPERVVHYVHECLDGLLEDQILYFLRVNFLQFEIVSILNCHLGKVM